MYYEQIEELETAIARMENSDNGWACVDAMKAAVVALRDAEQKLQDAHMELTL